MGESRADREMAVLVLVVELLTDRPQVYEVLTARETSIERMMWLRS